MTVPSASRVTAWLTSGSPRAPRCCPCRRPARAPVVGSWPVGRRARLVVRRRHAELELDAADALEDPLQRDPLAESRSPMTPSAASTIAALNSTAPRISDCTWPAPSPEMRSRRSGPTRPRDEPDQDRGGHEDAQRLVHRVDAEDRDPVAPDVGPHRREQARLAQLLVRADRDVVDRDGHLARLDDRLERVGELRDDLHRERGLAVVGAEARGGVGHRRSARPGARPTSRAAAATSSRARSARSS